MDTDQIIPIEKNSRWREIDAGNDRVKVESFVSGEVAFHHLDGSKFGVKGRMMEKDFREKFASKDNSDPKTIESYTEWKEKDAYRDDVKVIRLSSDQVVFTDINKSDYGVEMMMPKKDFLKKFELLGE